MKALHSVTLAATIVAALAASQAHAACTYPARPANMPDGSTATREQMLEAKKAVVEFDKAINEYTACIRKEHEETLAKSPDLTEAQKAEMSRMVDQKHNAAVEEDEKVAASFNEQLKAFNARNKK